MRSFVREFSEQARVLNSSERLWLVIAFLSSTESCVIGYNAHSCINGPISGSAPTSERRFEFSSWWFDALILILMWLYQICNKYYSAIFCLLEAAFKIHLIKTLRGTCPLTFNGHDASAVIWGRGKCDDEACFVKIELDKVFKNWRKKSQGKEFQCYCLDKQPFVGLKNSVKTDLRLQFLNCRCLCLASGYASTLYMNK